MISTIKTEEAELRGWTAIRLIAAICARDKSKLQKITYYLTINFEEKEIQKIWKRVKEFLMEEEIQWLKDNLRQSLADNYDY